MLSLHRDRLKKMSHLHLQSALVKDVWRYMRRGARDPKELDNHVFLLSEKLRQIPLTGETPDVRSDKRKPREGGWVDGWVG